MVTLMEAGKQVQTSKQAVKDAEAALEEAQSQLADALAQTEHYVDQETAEREAEDAAKRQRAEGTRAAQPAPHAAATNGSAHTHTEMRLNGATPGGGAKGGVIGQAGGAEAQVAQGSQEPSPVVARSSGFSLKPFTFQLSDP
jgi:hypothetical protein